MRKSSHYGHEFSFSAAIIPLMSSTFFIASFVFVLVTSPAVLMAVHRDGAPELTMSRLLVTLVIRFCWRARRLLRVAVKEPRLEIWFWMFSLAVAAAWTAVHPARRPPAPMERARGI